jgi:hypothetical protein
MERGTKILWPLKAGDRYSEVVISSVLNVVVWPKILLIRRAEQWSFYDRHGQTATRKQKIKSGHPCSMTLQKMTFSKWNITFRSWLIFRFTSVEGMTRLFKSRSVFLKFFLERKKSLSFRVIVFETNVGSVIEYEKFEWNKGVSDDRRLN